MPIHIAGNEQKGRGYTRYERKLEILAMLHVAMTQFTIGENSRCGLTVYDIAKQMQIAPSQHLRCIVHELVNAGIVVATRTPYRGKFHRVVYCVVSAEMWVSEFSDDLAVYFENYQDKVLL